MKPIIFHKGDFFFKSKTDSPIRDNDGKMEFYWHEYVRVCNLLKLMEVNHLPEDFIPERSEILKAILFYKYQLEKVPLFDTAYFIGEVESSS